jgi:hypothetical protein
MKYFFSKSVEDHQKKKTDPDLNNQTKTNTQNSIDLKLIKSDNSLFKEIGSQSVRDKLQILHESFYNLIQKSDTSLTKLVPSFDYSDPFQYVLYYKWPETTKEDVNYNTIDIKSVYEFWRNYQLANSSLLINTICITQLGLVLKIDKGSQINLSESIDLKSSMSINKNNSKEHTNLDQTKSEQVLNNNGTSNTQKMGHKNSGYDSDEDSSDTRRRVNNSSSMRRSYQLKRKAEEDMDNNKNNRKNKKYSYDQILESSKNHLPTENVNSLLRNSSIMFRDGQNNDFFNKPFNFY